MSRRSAIKTVAAGTLVGALATKSASASESAGTLKGRIKQSVSRWCYGGVVEDYDEFAAQCKKMGLLGIDLVARKDWDTLKKHGLVATMVDGAGNISNSVNRKENHKKCLEQFRKNILEAAKYGWPNVITFSGNRKGMSDEEGMENCAIALKEAAKIAEDHEITICMELLNSKVDHRDYMCDKSAWGIELCKRVDSPRVKLLYDIYHMQIMEGDVIRTINRGIDYFAHFHTGGNPGRKDLDATQELYYPPIMQAIAKLMDEGKYNGYVAHEFVPKHGMKSLEDAVKLCDV